MLANFRAERDLVRLVARARVHHLRERLVDAAHEDEELRVLLDEVVVRAAQQRAVLGDRVHDRPAQGEEDDASCARA